MVYILENLNNADLSSSYKRLEFETVYKDPRVMNLVFHHKDGRDKNRKQVIAIGMARVFWDVYTKDGWVRTNK